MPKIAFKSDFFLYFILWDVDSDYIAQYTLSEKQIKLEMTILFREARMHLQLLFVVKSQRDTKK